MLKAFLAIPAWGRRTTDSHVSTAEQQQPRLTLLVSSTQRRGAEVFGERLSSGLTDRGWSTELVALTGSNDPLAPTVAARPLSLRPASTLGRLDPNIVRSLRRHLRQSGADVILAYGSSTLRYGVAATRFMRSRPALAYASIGEPLYWARKRYQRLAYGTLLKMVDLVLSVSATTARQLSSGLGVPADRVRAVYTGIPKELLDLSPAPDGDGLRILFMGSLTREKDPMTAIEVFGRLATTVDARLRMVGAGRLDSALRKRIAELGLADRVEMTGSVEDVTPHLAWADVLLLTSLTEGLPAATLEAAAAGAAVVAFNVGGVGETMTDQVSGRLVKPGDLAGMVAALSFYAAHPQARQEAGQAGRKLVAEKFTIEESVRHHDVVLRELLARTGRRRVR
ncbi:MAG TPA: glycosyltransferase family 4 protein [Acidimicrobiia bacterium]|nr:glycosyltransferase family 4 protein [Acidimicrobiia bacterium]